LKIISFGCSITFGTDLPDSNPMGEFPTSSQLTWPALVAKNLGLPYETWAKGGSGNLSILDRLLNYLYYNSNDIFLINWTFIDRFDYSDPNGHHFDKGHNDYLTIRPGDSDQKNDFYFRNLHSEFRDKLTNLIYIKTAVNALRSEKARFIMTAIDDLLWCQKWHAPPHMVKLQNEISPDITNFEGRNFLDWSNHRGFEISNTGHPLGEAHQSACEIIMPKIQCLLKEQKDE
jgi:hypothetical protein